jgi:hypothetical protein
MTLNVILYLNSEVMNYIVTLKKDHIEVLSNKQQKEIIVLCY